MKDIRNIEESVLQAFGLDSKTISVEPIKHGLINHTWKISAGGNHYVLQKLNQQVFRQPGNIAYNIGLLGKYLNAEQPGYFFVSPVNTIYGESLFVTDKYEYYRMFPFVENSYTINVVETPQQAYEAAKQFGRFTALLDEFDSDRLKITIPAFHDLSLRYQQFETALELGNPDRIAGSDDLIQYLQSMKHIVNTFESIKTDPAFRVRVTHHDTKISNVLFDKRDMALCVIDLDTVMPGYFISDVGDMMRTYLSPANEEETDFSKISVRNDFYEAIVHGYLSEMDQTLTAAEQQHFFYAGCFMIYMQALRFLTDHLNDDIYYGAAYTGHNFNRAKNQATLLECFCEAYGLQNRSDTPKLAINARSGV